MQRRAEEAGCTMADHKRETPGGLDVGTITVVGIVSVLLVIVAVYAVQAWYFRFEQSYIAETEHRQTPRAVETYRAQQERRLNEARLRDPATGLTAIPIDEAMDLYLEQRLQSNP